MTSPCNDPDITVLSFACAQPPPASIPSTTGVSTAASTTFSFSPGGYFNSNSATNIGAAVDLINGAIADGSICTNCSSAGTGTTDLTALETQISTLQNSIAALTATVTTLTNRVVTLEGSPPTTTTDTTAPTITPSATQP